MLNKILLLFQPFIQPSEKFALPEDGILGLGDKMGLFRKHQQFCRNIPEPGCIVCFKALGIWDSKIVFTCNDHDGRIPFVYIPVG